MAIDGKNEINDLFWLNLGAEIVYNSSEERKKAVERLQKTIVWVFGVYSSLTIGSLVFTDKKEWNTTALLFFGIAVFFLILAYWAASVAGFPNPGKFYGSAVDSIRRAYLIAAKKGKAYFTVAVILCSLGVVFYSLSIFWQFGNKSFPKKVETKDTSPVQSPEAKLKKLGDGNYAVHIQSKKNEWVSMSIIRDSTKDKKVYSDPVDFSIQGVKQKNLWIYIDSTANQSYNFSLTMKPDHVYHLWINRTDTLEKGSELQTFKKKLKLE